MSVEKLDQINGFRKCAIAECPYRATKNSVFCFEHLMAHQKGHGIPPTPWKVWFADHPKTWLNKSHKGLRNSLKKFTKNAEE